MDLLERLRNIIIQEEKETLQSIIKKYVADRPFYGTIEATSAEEAKKMDSRII